MRLSLIFATMILASLAGCATIDQQLANRVSFTADDKEVLNNSMWTARFGFTSRVYQPDADALIAARKAAVAAAIAASAPQQASK